MKIKTYFFPFVLLLVAHIGFAQNNAGEIKITIIKHNNPKQSIPLANITIYNNSTQTQGTTDADGNCKIKLLQGKYNVKTAYKGYQTIIYKNVTVNAEKTTYVNMALKTDSTNTKKADTAEYSIPVIDPSTAGPCYIKRTPFPRLFFKFNGTNFDTLSNYPGSDLHIIDTNQVIAYIAKHILAHPNGIFAITAWGDINEQNPEELSKQRIEKVTNLLIHYGIPKDKLVTLPVPKNFIHSLKEIQNASTEQEKEDLHKANRCVMLRILRGG
ncbi:MAG TPA: carboxypeptidase-like regulatory domain-containing protein [Bacteroidia bacterium]|nr:carboxypeptidase-like regulatory domain-containing protein [Bacteroidia bacterium]